MAYAVTLPDTLEMIVGERLNLYIDFTSVIGISSGISNPVVVVTSAGTNEPVSTAIIGSPSLSGNILNLTISSVPLRPKTDYTVSFSCTLSSGSVATITLLVRVIY